MPDLCGIREFEAEGNIFQEVSKLGKRLGEIDWTPFGIAFIIAENQHIQALDRRAHPK